MTTLTAIPKVKSGYQQLDFAKNHGYSYNNAVANGYLVEGDSLVAYSDGSNNIESNTNVVDIWRLELDSIVTLTLDGNGDITSHTNGIATLLSGNIVGYQCSAIFDYDGPCVVISGSEGGYICYSSDIVTVEDMPCFASMTSHYGRIFGISGHRVSYCKSLDITNWSHSLAEGGYVDLPTNMGNCHSIISRGEYLYIFGDGGVIKMYAKTDAREFSVAQMTADMSPVCHGTPVLCGDNIWWLANNGSVYQLDSTDVECMVTIDCDNQYDYTSTLGSGYCLGKYVVPIKVTYPDDKRLGCEKAHCNVNSLLIVDTHLCSYQLLRGVDATKVTATNKLAVCISGSPVPYMFGSAICNRYWQSQLLTLSGHDHKRIDSISVDTDSAVTLIVISGKNSRQYYVDSGNRRVRVGLRGKQFYVGIAHSGNSVKVAPLGVYYTAFGTDKTGG